MKFSKGEFGEITLELAQPPGVRALAHRPCLLLRMNLLRLHHTFG
jgi:hypothetical protein